MSYIKPGRIAAAGVDIPDAVKVDWSDATRQLVISKGDLSHTIEINTDVDLEIEDNKLFVHAIEGKTNSKAISGTYTKEIENATVGLVNPWVIKIEIKGVGYKATPGETPRSVKLHLGYSNPIEYSFHDLINFEIIDNGLGISISCHNKQVLGQCAAEIYKKRPPNPYSGKGVKYDGKMFRKFKRKEVGK